MIEDCRKSIAFRCMSGRYAARDLLARVASTLGEWKLSPQSREMSEVVLAEALNNVVEHAYREQEGHPIRLALTLNHDVLTCVISDEGNPIPGGQAPDGAEPDLNVPQSDLPEGGFGWFLIHSMAQSVHYERLGVGNVLTIRLSVV